MSESFKDFNSFQRVLRNRNIEGPIAVVLTEMYVQQLDMAKQLDMCASLISNLVETVSNFTELHSATQGRVQDLMREIRGGDVRSEAITDESDYHG
jgi:hypothetical protein